MSSASPGDDGTDSELESEYQQPDDLATTGSDPSLTPADIREATSLLKELVSEGVVQPDRAQTLKYRYIDTSGKLLESRDNEKSLSSEQNRLEAWLSRQQELTEAFESASSGQEEGEEREVGRLRTKLLRISNDLEMSRERIVRLEFDEKNCREELEELQSEQDRISKLDNQDELRQQLESAIEDVELELKSRRSEASAVQGEIELALSYLREREEEYQRILMREDGVKKDLIQAKTAPTTILVAIDSINRQKDGVMQTMAEKQQQLEAFLLDFASAKEEVRRRENIREALHHELEQLEARFRDKLEEYSEIERAHGQEVLDQGGYEADFILIDKQYKEVTDEIRREIELLDKRQRMQDSLLKQLKRSDLSISRLEQDIEVLKGQKDNQQGELETRSAPIAEMERRIGEVQRSVREAHSMLDGQVFSQNTVDQDMQDMRAREGRLQSHLSELDKERKESCLLEKSRLKERGADAEKMYKLRITLEQVLDQIKTKAGVISEEGKCLKDMQNKVQHFAEMHQSVKRDVSDIIQMIQEYKQKSAELRERYKILETELMDCKDACEEKNKTLQRSRLKYTSVIGVRDAFLIDLSRARMQLMETRAQIEEQRGEIKKMSGMINAAEEEMVRLRKKYELMLQERNDRGIQLIERNEETAIFYERLNAQDSVLRKGNIELEGREEELRFLRVEITDLHRQIETLRKSTPKARQLESELTELQTEMTETHGRLRKLEKRAENPKEDPSRLVEVGSYPVGSFEELQSKSLSLEEQLVGKEMQLRERELLLEHVGRITEKAQTRVHQTSSYSRDQSSRMNEIQNQLKECTKKLMALLSEMSMQRAASLQLQREVDEKETELVESYQRLEQGLPPSEQADVTWQRMIRADRTRERQEVVMASEASSKIDLGGGVLTTAPRRPNAYIPEGDGELPIPKPYGSHAPFKPSDPGSNIRHIRKPQLKPIQL